MNQQGRRIGLSLSGGGYRAAAFHLGTLNKLNELGLLEKVDVMSTISGGSITGAAYCLNKDDYSSFHDYMIEKVTTKNVIREVLVSGSFLKLILFVVLFLVAAIWLMFTKWALLSFLVLVLMIFLLLKFQFKIFPASKEVEKAYDKFLYHGKTLKDLNSKPLLAIGSSNLQTGRPFTFSKVKMSDTTYSNYEPPIYLSMKSSPLQELLWHLPAYLLLLRRFRYTRIII